MEYGKQPFKLWIDAKKLKIKLSFGIFKFAYTIICNFNEPVKSYLQFWNDKQNYLRVSHWIVNHAWGWLYTSISPSQKLMKNQRKIITIKVYWNRIRKFLSEVVKTVGNRKREKHHSECKFLLFSIQIFKIRKNRKT